MAILIFVLVIGWWVEMVSICLVINDIAFIVVVSFKEFMTSITTSCLVYDLARHPTKKWSWGY